MLPPASHRRINVEPRWRPAEQFSTLELPPRCRPWLLDDGSLTQRLIGLGQGVFSVRRLGQCWQTPLTSERELLELPPRRQALVREVALCLDSRAVVFARSVFPVSSLSGQLGHLRRLQNRSLGAILFGHPRMHRSPFELALVPGDGDYLPMEFHQPSPAWGRRSRFDVAGQKLLVSEIFLHNFAPWIAILPVHRSQRGRVDAAIARPTQ